MTNKKIFLEISDMDHLEDFIKAINDKESNIVIYTKDFLKITEVDMDNATVRVIPKEGTEKVIVNKKKGGNIELVKKNEK